MTLHRGLFTLTLSVAASVIAVAACGPANNNVATIHRNDGKPTQSNACIAKLSHYSAKIDEKVTVKGKASTVEMCEADDVDPSGYAKPNDNASKPNARPAYKTRTENIRYTIGSSDKNLAISLNLGLLFPDGTPKDTSAAAVDRVMKFCVVPFEQTWTASQKVVALTIKVGATTDAASYDQTIELVAGNQKLDLASSPLFVLGSRPERGQLVLNTAPVPGSECAKSAECRLAFAASQNARFCSSFGLLIGEYLGLSSQESKNANCKAAAAPAAGTDELSGGFMAAEGLQNDPAQFWQRARFSKDDIKTILGPACDGNPTQTSAKAPVKDEGDSGAGSAQGAGI
jgi:hypothetical protein